MTDNSSVPRRQLGRSLRQARERAGITVEAAADEMEWSRTKIYRIETGRTSVRGHDVRLLCQLYGVPDELADALISLAKEGKNGGWWHAYGDIMPTWLELYVGLEESATHIKQYQPLAVPGLLQVRDYAVEMAMCADECKKDAEVAERRAELRMQRQRILDRKRPAPPVMDIIVDEQVLRRRVGSEIGWRSQLERLVKEMQRPRTRFTLRVVPADRGMHPGLSAGPYVIMYFVKPEPTTVYHETLTGALYLDQSAEVDQYEAAWLELEKLALDQDESAKLIRRVWDER